MSRRVEVPKREILPDPIYNSQLVTKFINVVMKDGKKSTAERIFYDALNLIGERIEGDVTGYIAQYEADWDRMGEVWRKALDPYRPKADDLGLCEVDRFACYIQVVPGVYETETGCRGAGHSWSTQGGCY